MSSAIQLALLPGVAPKLPSKLRRPAPRISEANQVILETFRRKLVAAALRPKSVSTISNQLSSILGLAEGAHGGPVSLLELFGRPELLGVALAQTRKPGADGAEYTRWTLAARRQAALRFGRTFSDELRAAHGVAGEELVKRAIRTQSEQVGTTYRLPGNRPYARRTRVATRHEASALLRHFDRASGPAERGFGLAARIMLETGARVNGLRLLEGKDVFPDPVTCRVTITIRSKGKVQQSELSRATGDALLRFIDSVNRRAEWPVVTPTSRGRIWTTARGPVSYARWNRMLMEACVALRIERLKPHDLRRTYATWAAQVAPRQDVAMAGGWDNLATLDRHYIHPAKLELSESAPPASRRPPAGGAGAPATKTTREETYVGIGTTAELV